MRKKKEIHSVAYLFYFSRPTPFAMAAAAFRLRAPRRAMINRCAVEQPLFRAIFAGDYMGQMNSATVSTLILSSPSFFTLFRVSIALDMYGQHVVR